MIDRSKIALSKEDSERGETSSLPAHDIAVSASEDVRDGLRNIVRGYFDESVSLLELEYQLCSWEISEYIKTMSTCCRVTVSIGNTDSSGLRT